MLWMVKCDVVQHNIKILNRGAWVIETNPAILPDFINRMQTCISVDFCMNIS